MAAGASAIFVVVGGGVAGAVATMTSPGQENVSTAARPADVDLGAPVLEESPEVVSRAAAAAEPLPARGGKTPSAAATIPAPARTTATADHLSRVRVADQRADRTGSRSARTHPQAPSRRKAEAEPVVTTRTDVETRTVAFDTRVVRDTSLPRGTRRVRVAGTPGEQTLRYLVTMTDGRPTARRLLSDAVTRKPQNRVVAVGAGHKPTPEPTCEQDLALCLPFGRTATCLVDGSSAAAPAMPPTSGDLPGTTFGEILISEEDLELLSPEDLDTVRLEPANLC